MHRARRAVVSVVLATVVVMSGDSCDTVTDEDRADYLAEAMARAMTIERTTGKYPAEFEQLGMDDLRSFTSTHLVNRVDGLCIELWIQEGGASHVTSGAPDVVEPGRCDA